MLFWAISYDGGDDSDDDDSNDDVKIKTVGCVVI